jgi:GNAT superfamily N-acetyltransferase
MSSETAPSIRPYTDADEEGWLRCSVLSFLHTAYFDSVYRRKPRYAHRAIELVAERDGLIVGVIDVECEDTPGVVCSTDEAGDPAWLGGMIWHLAVHPDFQRCGIAGLLLREPQQRAHQWGVRYFGVWTRDDPPSLRWYESHGFTRMGSYLHVYMDGEAEAMHAVQPTVPGLTPMHVFAHYTGDARDTIHTRFRRVHECNGFRLAI